MYRMKSQFTILIALILLAAACTGGVDTDATGTAESEAAEAEVALGVEQTAEARALEETQAAEAAIDEEATASAAAEMETQTAIEEATAAAEAAAAATQEAVNAAGTQQVEDQLAAIDEVLQDVGYSTSSGSLGWVQDEPEVITTSAGRSTKLVSAADDKEFSNFVLHANVTWDSGGYAGCGIILRSEDPVDNGQQYRFYTLRFSGLPAWDIELWEYNRWKSTMTGKVKYTSLIELATGATNNYILVFDGATATVYINGARITGVTVATRQKGLVGFFTWQQDGQTTCTFADAWIWELP